MLQWVTSNWPAVSAILIATVSEVIAVRQALKYPDNDGFGGILAALVKVLKPSSTS